MLNAKKVGIFSALLVTLLWACSGAMLEAQTKPQTISLTIGAGHPIAGQPYVLKAHDFLVPEITKRVLDKTGIQIKWNEAYAGSIAKVAEVLEATCQVPQHRLPGCATASFTFNVVKVPQHRLPLG